jgi:anti-anti-sigma factor
LPFAELDPDAACFGDSSRRPDMIRTECFRVDQCEDVTLVRFVNTKYFDTDDYAQLQRDLADFVEHQQPHKLLVDLGNVEYCSSALTNALLMAQRRVQARSGMMKLFGLSEHVLEALQRLRLVGTIFSVYPDEAAARSAC